MQFANCHFHSTHSDGAFRPMHLARLALGMGYRGAALTDHDVISGNEEFMREAEKLGLLAMTGVEISCCNAETGFHLVGLNFDPKDPALNAFIDCLCAWRNEHTHKLFDRGVRRGLLKNITWDEVEAYNPGCKWFANDQVFRAMELKGVFSLLDKGKLFRPVFRDPSASEEGIVMKKPSVEEAISVLRGAGGIPVLAHPHEKTQYVPALVEAGLLGIEVCHFDLTEEDTRLANEAAERFGLFRSGGSDHSGIMGGCQMPYTAPDLGWGADEENFTAMLHYRA